MNGTLIPLLEDFRSTGPLRVDREKGIIYGVKILGEKGNAAYPRSTREKVTPSLEGARVNVDHAPSGQTGIVRSYRDGFGVLRSIEEKGDGLYANYHFPPKHPLAEQLLWDAEQAAENLGFSIATRGRGQSRDTDGRQIIEEIVFDRRRHSVDLVSAPATTRGLFESLEPPMKLKISALIESLKAKRPGWSRALREQAEAGILSPDATMDGPEDVAPDAAPDEPADHEAALKQGFRGAVMAVMDDDTLDMKGKMAKIKEILAAEEKLLGGNNDSAAADDSGSADDSTAAEESRRATAKNDNRVALLESRERVRAAADDANMRVPRAVLELVGPGITEAQAKALVESLKPTTTTTPANGSVKPRSAAPWVDPATAKKDTTTPVQESLAPATMTAEERRKQVAELRSIR